MKQESKERLTSRQSRFLAAYQEHHDAKQAVIDAGYSAHSCQATAGRLLRIPAVREALEQPSCESAFSVVAEKRRRLREIILDESASVREVIRAIELDNALAEASGDGTARSANAPEENLRTVIHFSQPRTEEEEL